MPDKSLIDFIVAQKRIGAHIEKIRSDLLTSDWTDADIDAALVYIEERDKRRVARGKTIKKTLLIILGIVFILGGTYLALTLMGQKVPLMPEKKIELIQFPDFTEKVPDPVEEVKLVPPVVDDMTQVRSLFESEFKDMKYVRMERDKQDIIVSALATDEAGATFSKDLVYIKEDGIWHVSEEKTVARALYIASSSQVIMAPHIIVSEIKVRPLPPKVNNKDTEIQVFLKNTGLATTSAEIDVSLTFDAREPAKLPYKKLIGPGETASTTYKIYPAGGKYTDQTGKHTVVVTFENEVQKTLEFDLY